MIDLMMFDSIINNSLQINSMTIKLMTLIERLIKTLIEFLTAVEKFAVERIMIELIEKILIELIRAHIDTSEIVSITIEKLIDVRIINYIFNIVMFFRLMNHFWRRVIFDSNDFFNSFYMINDLAFDDMTIWIFDFAYFEWAILCYLQQTNVFELVSLINRSNHSLTMRRWTIVQCVVLLCVRNQFSKLLLIW